MLKNAKRKTAKKPDTAAANGDDTESDSDFESLNLVAKVNHGKRHVSSFSNTGRKRRVRQSNYLEEHLTIGELAGLIP